MEVKRTKKSSASSVASERRAFTVVLEDLHAKFDAFGEALQLVRGDVAELKSDVAELKSDVAELKSDVAELKPLHGTVAALRAEVAELREDVTAVRTDVGVLRRDVELLKVAVLDNVREIKQLRMAR